MNVEANKKQLTINCQIFSVGVEKLSLVINSRVAAASSPTTAGRRASNIDCIMGAFIYRMNIQLIRIINMNDGNISAKVAVTLPKIDMGIE